MSIKVSEDVVVWVVLALMVVFDIWAVTFWLPRAVRANKRSDCWFYVCQGDGPETCFGVHVWNESMDVMHGPDCDVLKRKCQYPDWLALESGVFRHYFFSECEWNEVERSCVCMI